MDVLDEALSHYGTPENLPYCQNSFQTHLLSIAGNGVQANLKAIFKQLLVCLSRAINGDILSMAGSGRDSNGTRQSS
jgi:hypothetical protein